MRIENGIFKCTCDVGGWALCWATAYAERGIPPGQPGHNGIKTITGDEIELLENQLGYVWDASSHSCIRQ